MGALLRGDGCARQGRRTGLSGGSDRVVGGGENGDAVGLCEDFGKSVCNCV